MKATINGIVVEGTPEELTALVLAASKATKAPRKPKTEEEKSKAKEAHLIKVASRIALPSALADAIKADGDENVGKKNLKTFAAYCIYKASNGDTSKMIAAPETIARLSTVYGISA